MLMADEERKSGQHVQRGRGRGPRLPAVCAWDDHDSVPINTPASLMCYAALLHDREHRGAIQFHTSLTKHRVATQCLDI